MQFDSYAEYPQYSGSSFVYDDRISNYGSFWSLFGTGSTVPEIPGSKSLDPNHGIEREAPLVRFLFGHHAQRVGTA